MEPLSEGEPKKDLHTILTGWNDRGYKIETVGAAPFVILLDEAHTVADQQLKQVELIRLLKPDFILHELAGGWTYDPQTQTSIRQPDRLYGDLDMDHPCFEVSSRILDSANSLNFQIIGIDPTYAELTAIDKQIAMDYPEDYNYERFPGGFGLLTKRDDPDWMSTTMDDLVIKYRDKFMVRRLEQMMQRTREPVIAILGAKHVSNIHMGGQLREKPFGYIAINQTVPTQG